MSTRIRGKRVVATVTTLVTVGSIAATAYATTVFLGHTIARKAGLSAQTAAVPTGNSSGTPSPVTATSTPTSASTAPAAIPTATPAAAPAPPPVVVAPPPQPSPPVTKSSGS
jgi:hypothetical protein